MRWSVWLLLTVALSAQAPPAFDVVSIRPNRSGEVRSNIAIQPGGRVVWTNVTLESLIDVSYQRAGFDRRDVIGPDWITKDRFDVIAQAPRDVPLTGPGGVPEPLFAMVRAMLAERFSLVVHDEQRERPIYLLSLERADGRTGPALKPSAVDCAAVMRDMANGRRPPLNASGRPPCTLGGPPGRFASDGLAMTDLAIGLRGLVGRPVVDRTSLAGAFDWVIEFAPDSAVASPNDDPAPPAPSDKPSIFTALREQLGLRLDASRGPVSVLVVERAERPTAN